jgi:N6-L-threonylcarbamoyladenine synthase
MRFNLGAATGASGQGNASGRKERRSTLRLESIGVAELHCPGGTASGTELSGKPAPIGANLALMRILGIESSCDETAAAVVEDGERVLSSIVASQMETHGKYGGVVPELASREHLRAIVPVVREALAESATRLEDVAAIAVTVGPGLVGSLLVGLTYAKSMSFSRGIPLIAVNHIEGHIHAVILEARRGGSPVQYPALALVVSGGHTHLFEVLEGFRYRLLGKTRDDAAGEAFDKVAKLLGYPYPGGPVIDRLAPHGNPLAVRFTFAKMKGNALDFSFSGLKTAVLRWVESHDLADEIAARRALQREFPQASIEQWLEASPRQTLDLLASFQHAVIHELLTRAAACAETIGARTLIISGGVACNSGLRKAAQAARLPYPVLFPTPGLSTDNAAMIAAAAFPKLERREFAGLDIAAQANLTLA